MSGEDKALAIFIVAFTGFLGALATPWAIAGSSLAIVAIALSKSSEPPHD